MYYMYNSGNIAVTCRTYVHTPRRHYTCHARVLQAHVIHIITCTKGDATIVLHAREKARNVCGEKRRQTTKKRLKKNFSYKRKFLRHFFFFKRTTQTIIKLIILFVCCFFALLNYYLSSRFREWESDGDNVDLLYFYFSPIEICLSFVFFRSFI